MKLSEIGAKLMHRFESCAKKRPDGRFEAYPDPKTGGDPWTIGWGHTGSEVVPGLVWTQEECDAAFLEDVLEAETMADDAAQVELTQGQYDAFVSLIYNIGPGGPRRDGIITLKSGRPSTFLRKLNEGDTEGAAAAILTWVSPGSPVEKGLRRRRVAERACFLGEDWEKALADHIAAGG